MQRLKASDFNPEILEIFDGYVHGKYSKREVLTRFSAFAVGGITATGILESSAAQLRARPAGEAR